MDKDYIIVLKESLQKKIKVLDEIMSLSKMQEEVLAADEFDAEAFDRYVDDKDICIEKLEKLDEGFETVYERVKHILDGNREKYADDIKIMQNLISVITDKSTVITALEKRNKNALSNSLIKERKGISEAKRSVNVAMNYYKNMSGMNVPDSQFIDKIK